MKLRNISPKNSTSFSVDRIGTRRTLRIKRSKTCTNHSTLDLKLKSIRTNSIAPIINSLIGMSGFSLYAHLIYINMSTEHARLSAHFMSIKFLSLFRTTIRYSFCWHTWQYSYYFAYSHFCYEINY